MVGYSVVGYMGLWEVISRKKPFDDLGGPAFRIMWAVHKGTIWYGRVEYSIGLPYAMVGYNIICYRGSSYGRLSLGESHLMILQPCIQDYVCCIPR